MDIYTRTLQAGGGHPREAQWQYLLLHVAHKAIPAKTANSIKKISMGHNIMEPKFKLIQSKHQYPPAHKYCTKLGLCLGWTARAYIRIHSTTTTVSRIVGEVAFSQSYSGVVALVILHNTVQHTSDPSTNHMATNSHQRNIHTQCIPQESHFKHDAQLHKDGGGSLQLALLPYWLFHVQHKAFPIQTANINRNHPWKHHHGI